MTSLVLAVFCLSIAFHMYQDAKRNGRWSWARFFSILAAAGVFLVAFIIPVAQWGAGPGHPRPGVVIAVMLSGIFIFVAGLIIVLRRMPVKPAPGDTPPNRLP
jgi:predicted membrane channel-forming protein YqfA (hemolysin III family)